jgi:hypothetical protein
MLRPLAGLHPVTRCAMVPSEACTRGAGRLCAAGVSPQTCGAQLTPPFAALCAQGTVVQCEGPHRSAVCCRVAGDRQCAGRVRRAGDHRRGAVTTHCGRQRCRHPEALPGAPYLSQLSSCRAASDATEKWLPAAGVLRLPGTQSAAKLVPGAGGPDGVAHHRRHAAIQAHLPGTGALSSICHSAGSRC